MCGVSTTRAARPFTTKNTILRSRRARARSPIPCHDLAPRTDGGGAAPAGRAHGRCGAAADAPPAGRRARGDPLHHARHHRAGALWRAASSTASRSATRWFRGAARTARRRARATARRGGAARRGAGRADAGGRRRCAGGDAGAGAGGVQQKVQDGRGDRVLREGRAESGGGGEAEGRLRRRRQRARAERGQGHGHLWRLGRHLRQGAGGPLRHCLWRDAADEAERGQRRQLQERDLRGGEAGGRPRGSGAGRGGAGREGAGGGFEACGGAGSGTRRRRRRRRRRTRRRRRRRPRPPTFRRGRAWVGFLRRVATLYVTYHRRPAPNQAA